MRLTPIIEQFKSDMAAFNQEREQHTHILMRYDEVITEKASKHMVEEIKFDISRNYSRLTDAQDIQRQVLLNKSQTEQMHQDTLTKFEDLNKAMSVEIYSAVKKAIKQMTQIVSKAQEDQENKSKGMNKDLLALIASKATKLEMEHINLAKSNKVDTE